MRVPSDLASAFGESFEHLIAQFATERGLLPDVESLHSQRFISRSVLPHVLKLSEMFNRKTVEKDAAHQGLAPYWKESSNPAHLRLAYFLYFMPSNLFRMASVWAELARLGFRWPEGTPLKGIELGAGPASGVCGIAAAEHFVKTGLPPSASWALLEQDKAVLELGREWAEAYFAERGFPDWGARAFHRKLTLEPRGGGLMPRTAPKFNLWLMSYFLNEFPQSPKEIAQSLLAEWDRHLEDEALIILVEPALKAESRKLLELRKELIQQFGEQRGTPYQILLPCLGHQACGALATAEDWCHEEVTWWRPPYFRSIDKMAGLDRKTLPFSYLVIARSRKKLSELLPALKPSQQNRYRLVSPAHMEGRDQEFFVCGENGKRRARYRSAGEEDQADQLERGDILEDAELRGDTNASRVEKIGKVR